MRHGKGQSTGQHPFGGQTEFCPNGERKLSVTRPRQGEKKNNELLQSLFFEGRRVVPDERLLCYPMSTLCPN